MDTPGSGHQILIPARQKKTGLRARQLFGKYKVEKLIAVGGFARVYSAMDTIEGVRVALKLPYADLIDGDLLNAYRQEARTVARLDHPCILPIKNADFIEGQFVIVTRLGLETLDSRLKRRIGVIRALDYFEQMISAVACAHEANVIHCDIKPENFIRFPGERIRLTDFGIAKVARMTIEGSGTGTVGYMAPEQAMGRPNKRSDVFSLGLILYRLLAGSWPEYPFDWPPPGAGNLRRKRVHPDLVRMIRKSISLRPAGRHADAVELETEFEAIYETALKYLNRKPR